MLLVNEDHGANAAARYDVVRSVSWKRVALEHLAKQPTCVACRHPGAHVCVHHIFPFHFCVALGRPDLELDPRNLVTLCSPSDARGAGDHHLLIGHLDDYESLNVHARREAEHTFHGMTAAQLRANRAWSRLVEQRPKHLGALDDESRRNLRALMGAVFPLSHVLPR